ncbi:MAG TPA: hypoxanthine phosphoribosyltransferase [Planctomycetes bacterium]|nr:hypoxanthine phosphoribosyltransferase [Planctomycetota bacterium]
MNNDIRRILFTEEQIQERIASLGREIAEDYDGDALILMAMLKGGVVFISDLMRRIPMKLDIDFIQPSSYGNQTESTGIVDIRLFPEAELKGKRILVLDDILDTGRTLLKVTNLLRERGATDVRTCVLLDKKARRIVNMEADYVGFEVPDYFVVGYGLDFADKYRNLPYIGVLREECYGGGEEETS